MSQSFITALIYLFTVSIVVLPIAFILRTSKADKLAPQKVPVNHNRKEI